MSTNKELLNTIREALASMHHRTPALNLLKRKEALAALDQLEAQQQPKRLTDEEIKAEMMRYDESLEQSTNFDATEVLQMGTAYGAGMRHARDSGYLGGLTVDEATEVAYRHTSEWLDKTLYEAYKSELRARLTAKLQGQ
jgi:hypothetical protein